MDVAAGFFERHPVAAKQFGKPNNVFVQPTFWWPAARDGRRCGIGWTPGGREPAQAVGNAGALFTRKRIARAEAEDFS
jgi:hypothetical protein